MHDRLPFRQIHLDFHTHESIDGIGADFDPNEFADTLVKARVNSINLFARGHHGWMYYNSKAFPERKHPHLTRNLLKEQIEACHARGIKAPVYVSIQWDAQMIDEHPEWCVRHEWGGTNANCYEPGFYTNLCVNTPYQDFLREHVKDIFDCVPVDGFWFDIVIPRDCSCTYCRREMIAKGIDPSDADARMAFSFQVMDRFKRSMSEYVRSIDPNALIFYNAGHVGPATRNSIDAYTHMELESLPFAWGYTHFPMSSRYARTLGQEFLGMTGKFHTAWGDFHSFKNREALEFECFSMIAQGGKCCIGDQLPPRGKICEHTYDLIGSVYSQVEEREAWCDGATPVTEVAVLSPEEFAGTAQHENITKDIKGATHMLQELGMQFDIVDTKQDLSTYKLLILVETIPVDETLAAAIEAFINRGGKVIANHRAGLAPDGTAFALDLGVSYRGEDPWDVPFVKPSANFGADLRPTEYASYQTRGGDKKDEIRGTLVEAAENATVIAEMVAPTFNRTWDHYCSHRHAPSTGKVYAPAVVMTENTGYISQPIFSLYGDCATQWARQLLKGVIDRLLPTPLLRVENAPRSLVSTVMRQAHEDRTLVHLLNYIPRRNNDKCEIIEDVIPLHDVTVHLRTDETVSTVRCVPEDKALDFTEKDGVVSFTLPKVGGYQIVEVR
ncbi:MAG: beta-galactosidase trimerization domain-containing protein [Planctomycetota bacterium]|jgi:hypothetical protein